MRKSNLTRLARNACKGFKPPEDLSVSEWADKYRYLSPEASAEPGLWSTARTPYLKEPMDALSDPKCERITMMTSSQVGKSEFLNNCIGHAIDQDPGPILLVQPTLDEARNFSRTRIKNMIRDSPVLSSKVSSDAKQGRSKKDKNTDTVLQRTFTGGTLSIVGANSASALASKPIRYLFGDEIDRWPESAGDEGDPMGLAVARTETFYNRKIAAVSTPTTKGASPIYELWEQGTQESWVHECPHCHRYSRIVFDDVRFKYTYTEAAGKTIYDIDGEPWWVCPKCGCISTETEMREQPQKWLAANPDAYESRGHRSFRMNAFASPWTDWRHIIIRFLESKDDPQKLKVVKNTLFGELWEDRGDIATEEEMLERREDYGEVDGIPVELPEGVLILTCGVDVQDDRLEYEVVGHGNWGETWGIEYGIINGIPNNPEVWQRLDDLIMKPWRYANGKTLRISLTCIDTGGHFTQQVYQQCRTRWNMRVRAIKGKGGPDVPYIGRPSDVQIRDTRAKVRLYMIGVDAGKTKIMSDLMVEQPGARFCHFPSRPEAGYDIKYFEGLISEHLVRSDTKRTTKFYWEKLPGHDRNEPLDCRNYALAALAILNPSWERLEKQRNEAKVSKTKKRRAKSKPRDLYDGW